MSSVLQLKVSCSKHLKKLKNAREINLLLGLNTLFCENTEI